VLQRPCLSPFAGDSHASPHAPRRARRVAARRARCEGPADADKPDPEVEQAKAILKQYLDGLVKAAEARSPSRGRRQEATGAKKFIHPKTLELITSQEKKNLVTNGLAVWCSQEDYWLMEYTLEEARKATLGAVVVEAKEKNCASPRAARTRA